MQLSIIIEGFQDIHKSFPTADVTQIIFEPEGCSEIIFKTDDSVGQMHVPFRGAATWEEA
jgi:hypothetical protein